LELIEVVPEEGAVDKEVLLALWNPVRMPVARLRKVTSKAALRAKTQHVVTPNLFNTIFDVFAVRIAVRALLA